jgi:hypothetical protein
MEFVKLDVDSLKFEYLAGSSLRFLASKYGTSKMTVKRKLLKVGVKIVSSAEFVADKERHKLSSTPVKKYENNFIMYSNDSIKKVAFDNFVNKAKSLFGNKFDYSKFVYDGHNIKGIIVCPTHGEFIQTPEMHLHCKRGCPSCSKDSFKSNLIEKESEDNEQSVGNPVSLEKALDIIDKVRESASVKRQEYFDSESVRDRDGQQEIVDFIKSYDINYEIKDGRNICIMDKKIFIEYCGFYNHSFSHEEVTSDRNIHSKKATLCLDNGIRLLQVFEDEWFSKNNVTKSIILNKLGLSNNNVYARKCEIIELSASDFNDFCNDFHIQGKLNSTIRIGLCFNGEVVCVMGFNKHHKYSFECTRLCSRANVSVIGGPSRIFSYFIGKFKPESVLSFADRRYSDGNVYKKLGFELSGITDPGYFYVKGTNRYSRQMFQKHKLSNRLSDFDESLSETKNMFNNGYRRLWDAGHWRFVWKNIVK